MTLPAGTRLGPYEILDPLGAGGMGEVYRARDTRLDRTVAVKILPAEFASEPTARARFEREARAISALQHPHICALHDVGEDGGRAFLVMEHLVGESLADRLRKGALPLPQSLDIGAQIADALAAAHRQGIVHRDLKPGNVMLTKTGTKLLDFGLARLAPHGERAFVEDLTSAPTESAPLTGRRTIVGTIPYMAPEQLEGKPADARTDIWALGTVLYEMITGERAFEGTSSASLVAAILEHEPAPLSERQPLTPPALDRLIRRCLAKSPDERWDGAHDVADELRWIAQGGLAPAAVPKAPPRRRWLWALVSGALAVALVSVGVLVGRRLPVAPRPAVVQSLLRVSPADEVNAGAVGSTWSPTPGGSRTALAWTPDGRSLVFVGRRGGVQQLYVRQLDSEQARPLEGTEGAQVPVVSADGGSVAFWANRAIRRVPLGGGPVAVLVENVPWIPTHLAWRGDGRLFYDVPQDSAIWSAEAEGAPAAVTRRLEGEVVHGMPHLLPNGHALLYTVRHRYWTWGDEEVVAHVLATGERKVLLRDAADARYVGSGHLVFLRRGTLFSVRFDAGRLEVQGAPEPVRSGVAQALTATNAFDVTGAGQFSVASTGALAYLRGEVVPYPDAQLVEVDRQGRVSPLDAPARSYTGAVSLSPSGLQLAASVQSITEITAWLFDLRRGSLVRLPGAGESDWPRWTPDGSRVALWNAEKGALHLVWQAADGTGARAVLAPDRGSPSSWSPDGRQLAYVRDFDIWILTLEEGKATAAPVATTPEAEESPEFSPDGRWLAFVSNVSGRDEVYVEPYPGPGPRQLVSRDGGTNPAWSAAGCELFFLSLRDPGGNRRMMAADVDPGPTLRIGRPRPLFSFSQPPLTLACTPVRCYAAAPDGQRFFATRALPTPPSAAVTQIELVQNWTEELKARVPGRAVP